MIVSQRPSEVNSTILSQCGTFFALRLTNSKDRSQITSALSDNLDGLTGMLPILRTGEAIVLGEAVKLPMRTFIEPPPRNRRPDSQDPVVYDDVPLDDSQKPGGWGIKMEEAPNYGEVVETWRAQSPNRQDKPLGATMERKTISSTNISAVGYDEASGTLEVEFANGSIYQYFDVPRHVYEEFLGAASAGSYLAKSIKGNYRFGRI